ncbi:MAG: tRNA pseudouridine(38-40) synthase TruA [Candidatus Neomarinimicrobiota bacterium]
MTNFKITVEYDGTHFSGWQLQRDRRTVQGELEKAAKRLNGGRRVRIHGAGRTDAGVHARGQVANFKLAEQWKSEELKDALNGNLEEDILVNGCESVSGSFHARHSAIRRLYRYYCLTRFSVMNRKYVWSVPAEMSLTSLRQCAGLIQGSKDFTSFCKYVPHQRNRQCVVNQSQWIKRGDFVIFTIESNRFLQHMIRYLVGTMMEVAKRNLTGEDFETLLASRDPAAKVFKAPPNGLFLEKVAYL